MPPHTDTCCVVPATAISDQASPVMLSTVEPYAVQRFDRVAAGVALRIPTCVVADNPLPRASCCIESGGTVTGKPVGLAPICTVNVCLLFESRFTMPTFTR